MSLGEWSLGETSLGEMSLGERSLGERTSIQFFVNHNDRFFRPRLVPVLLGRSLRPLPQVALHQLCAVQVNNRKFYGRQFGRYVTIIFPLKTLHVSGVIIAIAIFYFENVIF
jgi:hypothetical protein